jgi:hypothetical protein
MKLKWGAIIGKGLLLVRSGAKIHAVLPEELECR